jgi:hypothetical protein
VNLGNVEITYTPKWDNTFIDPTQTANEDSAVFAKQVVRAAFRNWVSEKYPSCTANTISTICSEAYYIYNNNRGISLAEAINEPDGLDKASKSIEHWYEVNPVNTATPPTIAKRYTANLRLLKEFIYEKMPELLNGNAKPAAEVPQEVFTVLAEKFSDGFRFETTSLRLLSDWTGISIDTSLQNAIKQSMFCRNDDVYFLLDTVCDAKTRKDIINFAGNWLDDYGCFELSELYGLFSGDINNRAIGSLENFTAFYEFINKRDVRCVKYYRTRIARINRSVKDLSTDIATRIITMAHDEYGGTIDEDILRDKFSAFSAELLTAIIKEHAEELVKTEINGIVCYQTLDALGLSDEFTDTLAEVLEQLDDLGLVPSEEVLHTALSIRLGVNFKAEYNIPDDKTYRRLIETYYKNVPKRKWLRGIFAEVPG